jgi:uncharacterized membrane protein
MLAALTCVMTVVPRIPIPLGYAHLGDAVIFLAAIYAGRQEAALAASIGSALADFIGGFPIWMVPTFLIKYIMVIIVWKLAAGDKRISLRVVLAFILSALWMALGYTVVGALLYGGIAVGLTSTPGLLLEGAVNVVAAVAAGLIVSRKLA